MVNQKELRESVSSEPKNGMSKLKLFLIGVGVFLLLVLGVLAASGYLNPPKIDPMAQFVTEKTCSFLEMGEVSRAICPDGTVYDIEQIGGPSSPLP